MIFYSYIEKKTDYKYIVKIDDGCLLNLNNMITNLHVDYCGTKIIAGSKKWHWGKCKDVKLNTYISDLKHGFDDLLGSETFNKLDLTKIAYAGGGYSYRLSRNALIKLNNYKKYSLSLEFSYEDLFIGQVMKINNIKLIPNSIGRYHKLIL
jgi:hypothetical protein